LEFDMKKKTKAKRTRRRMFMRREYGIGDFLDRTNGGRGLADAARQVAAEEQMEQPTTNDCVLAYMYKNMPPERWTLDTYIALAYLGDRGLEDLGPEELAELPAELYPPPETDKVQ